jgi:hypothetical protein
MTFAEKFYSSMQVRLPTLPNLKILFNLILFYFTSRGRCTFAARAMAAEPELATLPAHLRPAGLAAVAITASLKGQPEDFLVAEVDLEGCEVVSVWQWLLLCCITSAHPHSYSLSLTLTHTHSSTHSLAHTHTVWFSLSLTHTHTPLTPPHSTHSHTHSPSCFCPDLGLPGARLLAPRGAASQEPQRWATPGQEGSPDDDDDDSGAPFHV